MRKSQPEHDLANTTSAQAAAGILFSGNRSPWNQRLSSFRFDQQRRENSMSGPNSNMYGIIPESPPDLAKKPGIPRCKKQGFRKLRVVIYT